MIKSYYDLLNQIMTKGKKLDVRGLTTKELIDQTLIINEENFFYSPKVRPFDKVYKYFIGELIWYLSGNLDIKYIGKYSKFWANIVNKDNTINSNYGNLVFYKPIKKEFMKKSISQFDWCVNQLTKDSSSRKAVILYNDKQYYYESNRDFICTQLQQFMIRDNDLTSIVYIRSSDAILGLTYDIPWWSFVQQQLFNTLKLSNPKLKVGKLTIHLGSVHIYEDKYQLVYSMLKSKIRSKILTFTSFIPLNQGIDWYKENIKRFIDVDPIEFNLDDEIYSALP